MKIFIFDFDNTITRYHTHNMIMSAINEEIKKQGKSNLPNNPEACWELVKDVQPITTPEKWQELFTHIIRAGHKIAIASYNTFGNDIIPRYLKETLKLPNEIINNIPIQSFLPKDRQHGKNLHIKNLLNHIGEENPEVILIDDDTNILIKAKEANYHTILATEDGQHLNLTFDAITTPPKDPLISQEADIRQPTLNIYMIDHFSNIKTPILLKNSIIITSDNKIYDIDSHAIVTELNIPEEKLTHLLSTMNLTLKDLATTQTLTQINHKVNDQTRDAYNKIVMPDFEPATKNEPAKPSLPSSTLKVTLMIRNKSIEVDNIHPNTSFRTFLLELESSCKIAPTTRGNSSFFLNSHNINTVENLDKPLLEIAKEEYGDSPIPDNLTITISRK